MKKIILILSVCVMLNSVWAQPNLSSIVEQGLRYKSDKNSYTFTTNKKFAEIQRHLSTKLNGKWRLDTKSMKVEGAIHSVFYKSVLESNQKIWLGFKQLDGHTAMCEIAFIE